MYVHRRERCRTPRTSPGGFSREAVGRPGSMDDLLKEWPQVREAERPLLRSGLGAIRVPWAKYITEYTRDPMAAIRAANHASVLKFRAVVDAAYGRTRP